MVVLTRPDGYRKKPSNMGLVKNVYRKYPAFIEAMEQRYIRYNQTLEEIRRLEAEGELLVIRPSRDPDIGRMEKRPAKVQEVYRLGYTDAMKKMEQVKTFLTSQ